MYFPDLTPCSYFPIDPGGRLLAVGWLDPGHEYDRGEVSLEFVRKLVELLADPWQPVTLLGWHDCGFCRLTGGPSTFRLGPSADGPEVQVGIANVFVTGRGVLYVAPSLILHYIDAHEYAPPAQFQQAVLACPLMRSMDYFKAVLTNGPRGITALARQSAMARSRPLSPGEE
jgi:hypothetical protein